MGGRSTAIRLASGDVWVLASTTLDDSTKKTIDEMGPVKYAPFYPEVDILTSPLQVYCRR